MPVRGTPNYVWFTEAVLGKGSTGAVYRGRHKRQGTLCAVKLFNEEAKKIRADLMLRELEVLTKLEHKNVVKMLAIEEDTKNKDKVLIMELCSEGSVHDMLQKPVYYYGFPEDEFLQFLYALAGGMEYLKSQNIVHRDIKPANVLCNREIDGRFLYKLTDFGSARELLEQEQFKSIYGTEEYLHPDVYGAAMFGASTGVGREAGFSSAVDIWSAGATLYHVATGRIPFKPFLGRDDRTTMYEIIRKKTSGSVCGVQKVAEGPIIYSDNLPSVTVLSVYALERRTHSLTAVMLSQLHPYFTERPSPQPPTRHQAALMIHRGLSTGLRRFLVPLMARMLEKDKSKQCSHNEFFAEVSNFMKKTVVHFYCIASIKTFRAYMNSYDTMAVAVRQLPKVHLNAGEGSAASPFTTIPEDKVHLIRRDCRYFFQDLPVESWIGSLDKPLSGPVQFRTTFENPIILWSRLHVLKIYVQFPDKPSQSDVDGAMNMKRDFDYCREVVAIMYYIRMAQIDSERSQVFISKVRKLLSEQMYQRLIDAEFKYHNVSQILTSSSFTTTEIQELKNFQPLALTSKPAKSKKKPSSVTSSSTIKPNPVNDRDLLKLTQEKESLMKFAGHIKSAIKRYRDNYDIELMRQKSEVVVCDCVTMRCLNKMEFYIEKVTVTYDKFKEECNGDLSYNEQQIHKYNKIKMEDNLNKAICLFNEHCLKGTERSFQNAVDWYRGHYDMWDREIIHLEKDVEKFEADVRNFTSLLTNAHKQQSLPDIRSLVLRGEGQSPRSTRSSTGGSGEAKSQQEDSDNEEFHEASTSPPKSSPVDKTRSKTSERRLLEACRLMADDQDACLNDIRTILNTNQKILDGLLRGSQINWQQLVDPP